MGRDSGRRSRGVSAPDVPPAPPTRGEVWLVRLPPAVGAELQRVRPAVIVNSPAFDADRRRIERRSRRGSPSSPGAATNSSSRRPSGMAWTRTPQPTTCRFAVCQWSAWWSGSGVSMRSSSRRSSPASLSRLTTSHELAARVPRRLVAANDERHGKVPLTLVTGATPVSAFGGAEPADIPRRLRCE